ncbi:ADP-ribosylation/Crystallin J1 [Gloeocapsa sp. PCC 7428]|uniref:ADP-ribosylglycohydrolase family protein n=1 Tax=Gloeocapsa sp. PCC 7428 TaxID=1173026 RepID=UPI0002A5E5D6|nr:ADP-ribosylglycohydrolase family protein [Gloeocapsa sp. PCC 7428]AFZ31437.1 ADP-ribosylation/Crystallin J1 [Gloeocapsa sp. PCC 7428]
MRYSLGSRFRGTLLGAAIGGMLTQATSSKDAQIKAADFTWERLATEVAQSLIRQGNLSYPANQSKTSHSVKVIIATLPIALFYHENETRLQAHLQQFVAWQNDPEIIAGVLAVGYAIASSLREMPPANLMGRVIQFIAAPQLQLTQQLVQVQSLLKHQASLAKAIAVLGEAQPTSAIALALYCYLSTPEDFSLSLRRAAHLSQRSPAISSIVGALSGVYNGTTSIPLPWRLALARDRQFLALWGMQSEAELLRLCDTLVAAWSGAYNTTIDDSLPTAIAAPQVIRPR